MTDYIYVKPAQLASLIRKHLKNKFPGVKFGVRTEMYSMGSNISVTWTDGPSHEDVSNAIDGFRVQSFDGRDDSTNHHRFWLMDDGSAVSLNCPKPKDASGPYSGSSFISISRDAA